ncbi:hypothetical protein C8A01DRAFT_19746 [Parachaetomium inaequale]|uniref:Uncharacterized protein n=1 Tax=Parachaetomium inaequale TaxID=2588326 RepID=A0AAN6SN21_9PEZI|nr:hypothetical protein C8A01DRAFT_19746 [Parachaetomium inaequale]
MARIPLALILLAFLATLASATVPSFCKCTCFQNSTIIPLGPQHDSNNQPPPPPSRPKPSPSTTPTSISRRHTLNTHPLLPRESSTSCKQCNRAFCLKYNLPICKDAEEKDIKTSCFQRDSPKDRVIVWGFLLGTAGLLGWAALRRVIDSARERRERLRQGAGAGVGAGMGMGGGRFASLGGLIGGGRGGGNVEGDNGRGFRTASGAGGVDTGVYNPLEDGHDEGVTRGPG